MQVGPNLHALNQQTAAQLSGRQLMWTGAGASYPGDFPEQDPADALLCFANVALPWMYSYYVCKGPDTFTDLYIDTCMHTQCLQCSSQTDEIHGCRCMARVRHCLQMIKMSSTKLGSKALFRCMRVKTFMGSLNCTQTPIHRIVQTTEGQLWRRDLWHALTDALR